jgi:hypothetical protein
VERRFGGRRAGTRPGPWRTLLPRCTLVLATLEHQRRSYGSSVIVWVSSFPRSGNTFLRIVLKQLYEVRTSVVYDVDGVAERLGADMVGFTERPAAIEVMRASTEVHFVKTHRQRDDQIKETDPATCLVRDGRDALVSWARLTSEADSNRYEPELRRMIASRDTIGTGSWGRNVLGCSGRSPTTHRRCICLAIAPQSLNLARARASPAGDVDRVGGLAALQRVGKRHNVRPRGREDVGERGGEPIVGRIVGPEGEHTAGMKVAGDAA